MLCITERASGELQVWKTYMGRNRNATTVGSIRSIYHEAGGGLPGISAFWAGTGPKVSKAIHDSLSWSCRVMQSLLEPSMLLRGCWMLAAAQSDSRPLSFADGGERFQGHDPHVCQGGHPEGSQQGGGQSRCTNPAAISSPKVTGPLMPGKRECVWTELLGATAC